MKHISELSDLQLAMVWSAMNNMMETYPNDGEETDIAAMDITLSVAEEITARYPGVDVEEWVLERTPYAERDSTPNYPFKSDSKK